MEWGVVNPLFRRFPPIPTTISSKQKINAIDSSQGVQEWFGCTDIIRQGVGCRSKPRGLGDGQGGIHFSRSHCDRAIAFQKCFDSKELRQQKGGKTALFWHSVDANPWEITTSKCDCPGHCEESVCSHLPALQITQPLSLHAYRRGVVRWGRNTLWMMRCRFAATDEVSKRAASLSLVLAI